MIVGIGVELVDVSRFEAALSRFGTRMEKRLFTAAEREYAGRKARASESLAVRFAAKVAASRALGLRGSPWQVIEVLRERGGAPTLSLHGAAADRARELGVSDVALTLTHDAALCAGHVVLEARS